MPTDFNMRGLSGVEVARKTRAGRAYLPIILVSGFVDEEARRRAMAVGVNRILATGASAYELSRAVERLLESENFRDATSG